MAKRKMKRKAGKRKLPPIKIKHPGQLTRAVGGKPSEHMAAVKRLEKGANKKLARDARFFVNVLQPGAKRAARNRRKKK